MREFTVTSGVRGFCVRIGCQIAGFSTKEDLLVALTEYITDPEATEKKYYSSKECVEPTQVACEPNRESNLLRRNL